jgi:hypothetical protein
VTPSEERLPRDVDTSKAVDRAVSAAGQSEEGTQVLRYQPITCRFI